MHTSTNYDWLIHYYHYSYAVTILIAFPRTLYWHMIFIITQGQNQ